MTSDKTIVERHDGLVVVTLNRPHKKNALNAKNWNDLEEVLAQMEVTPVSYTHLDVYKRQLTRRSATGSTTVIRPAPR